ncbi:MAG TPA: tetratricopeptide repeat protein, partial [Tepidisphaeraceae bacterium]|nr:tetratricopeptide repeat protein [Tepidisphaeraceae bacterium]
MQKQPGEHDALPAFFHFRTKRRRDSLMDMNKLYRTFLAAGFAVAAMAAVGCSQVDENHKKFVKDNRGQFDVMRLQLTYEVAAEQYKTGELDKCRETLKSALAVPTPYAPMHVLAGKLEMEGDHGNLETAAVELKKAVEINGEDPEPYYLLGVVYQRWQKFETACGYYQQAVDHKSSEASYVLAVAEMKMTLGQLDDAQQLLEDKMLYFEQSGAMHIALAKIATLKGDHAAAAKHLRDATLLLPEDQNV